MLRDWLVLTHHIPPKPLYLRAKTMRRLSQLGALALKRSTYVLPAGESTREDLEWLRREIQAGGGDAWLMEGTFIGGPGDDELRERFRSLRTSDYGRLAAGARAILPDAGVGLEAGNGSPPAMLRRLRRRFEAVRRIDFFDADGREEVEALMTEIDRLANNKESARTAALSPQVFRARTWATRAGVKVDRMGSAWLIRRFIDPAARFVFLGPSEGAPGADVLRFDMYDGGFTHDGDRCTFEVLIDVAGAQGDLALRAIAQIVHDLDLRDDRYQRPETAGVGALIAGTIARFDDDERRIAEGARIFDSLYATLGASPAR